MQCDFQDSHLMCTAVLLVERQRMRTPPLDGETKPQQHPWQTLTWYTAANSMASHSISGNLASLFHNLQLWKVEKKNPD